MTSYIKSLYDLTGLVLTFTLTGQGPYLDVGPGGPVLLLSNSKLGRMLRM